MRTGIASDRVAGVAAPEHHDRPLEAVGGAEWEGAGVDLDELVLMYRDVEAAVGREAVAESHRQRPAVGREDLPELVERPELRGPLVAPQPPDLLEAAADQLAGGIVEEDEH